MLSGKDVTRYLKGTSKDAALVVIILTACLSSLKTDSYHQISITDEVKKCLMSFNKPFN